MNATSKDTLDQADPALMHSVYTNLKTLYSINQSRLLTLWNELTIEKNQVRNHIANVKTNRRCDLLCSLQSRFETIKDDLHQVSVDLSKVETALSEVVTFLENPSHPNL